jgi:cardiolipin synthase
LIPLIIWIYCFKKNYTEAAWIMLLSALTDIADGFIARKFNMGTDWGKIIDPIADKLTQITMAGCLAWRYPPMQIMLILLIAKEIYMGIIGLIFIHKTDQVEGSVWYGKATTVLFFIVVIALLLFPALPNAVVIALVSLENIAIILSMLLYSLRYLRLYKAKKVEIQ